MRPLPCPLSPARPAPDPRPSTARRFAALLLGVGLLGVGLLGAGPFGCMRTGPLETAAIDCGAGALVIIDSSALCVYRPPDIPEACPEALPNIFDVDGVIICARQVRPAGSLLERAAERVSGSDGGLFIVDAGADPVDGGAGRPAIVDQGGATGSDF